MTFTTKRLGAAQLMLVVQAACRLAESRHPHLFAKGVALGRLSRECDEICMAGGNFLLWRGADALAATTHDGLLRRCMAACEACAGEAEKLEEQCLLELVRSCREAAFALKELFTLLGERGSSSPRRST